MFNFFKKKKDTSPKVTKYETEAKSVIEITTGFAATEAAKQATEEAAKTFAKPETYTGNRDLYDSGVAKKNAKVKLFDGECEVIDPYTGDKLVLTKQEAKAANSDDNIRVASRKFNNPKRSRTNKEYIEDEEYLKSKGVEVTEEGKQQAIRDGEFAEASINKQLQTASAKNVIATGHMAGKVGAQNAGVTALTMSSIMNTVAVVKGEKSGEEALADIAKTSGKAAVTGYAMSGGLTVASHSLANSSSKFIQGLVQSNVPGKAITAVLVTGDTLKKWGNGEITTQQCLIELGDKGLNLATAGYSMAIGQALIPIPIVGGALGALVGSALTSNYYNELIHTLQIRELEHQERMRIIAECKAAAEQTKIFRQELESYLNLYFKEYKDCFDGAISSMKFAYQVGDADGMIAAANDITRKLGGQVYYETVEEFEKFIEDEDTVEIF